MANDPMITVKVIAATTYHQTTLISLEATYPRVILAEVNTHRSIAKSTASSRAIPVQKQMTAVHENPYMPDFRSTPGQNRPWMQAVDVLSAHDADAAIDIWQSAQRAMLAAANNLYALGVHKQWANRLIEPFSYVTSILSATEENWNWFLELRDSPLAQPEIQDLARKVRAAIDSATPRYSRVHLPYVDPEMYDGKALSELPTACLVSAARCARVSYRLPGSGAISDIQADEELANRLIRDKHYSPFDHGAIADERSAPKTPPDSRHYAAPWNCLRGAVESGHLKAG